MNGNQYTQKSIEAINAAQALAGEYGNAWVSTRRPCAQRHRQQ